MRRIYVQDAPDLRNSKQVASAPPPHFMAVQLANAKLLRGFDADLQLTVFGVYVHLACASKLCMAQPGSGATDSIFASKEHGF